MRRKKGDLIRPGFVKIKIAIQYYLYIMMKIYAKLVKQIG